MFRKSNDRLGNPDHEKTRLEDPVTTDLIVCSRPGKPTEHQSEYRSGDSIIDSDYENLNGNDIRPGEPNENFSRMSSESLLCVLLREGK